MGRAPKFTHEQLQTTALAIVDEQGLDALSMRTLAQALGTGPMTLYNYVATREALDVLVVEAVAAGIHWELPVGLSWEDELRHVARAAWRALREHPNVVPLMLTRRSRSPAALKLAEALLAPLARGGFSGNALLIAFRSVMALIVGLAQAELAGPLALKVGESASDTIARFRALPVEQFPHLREAADAARSSTAAGEFEMALGLLIAGLKSSLPM